MQIPPLKIGQEECLKQRKTRKRKSRGGNPGKQRNFDGGKSKKANPAVEKLHPDDQYELINLS